jgi:F-type H+-transporting ATPase subunit epsilon
MSLQLEIVTPAHRVLTVACDEVRLPGAGGGLGIRSGHTPLVTLLVPGELVYLTGDTLHRYAVGEGYGEVAEDRVRVLVHDALRDDELDAGEVERELLASQKTLAAVQPGSPEYELRRAEVERAAARALVVSRR